MNHGDKEGKPDQEGAKLRTWFAPGTPRVRLSQIHASPNIYVIDNFLGERELKDLEVMIKCGTFDTSFVDGLPNNSRMDQQDAVISVELQHRNSSFMSFRSRQSETIRAIERRAIRVLGGHETDIEALQLVRYMPGQFFGLHHDLGNLNDDNSVELPPKLPCCKRRLATIFCYLNTLEDNTGGCTYFPACDDLRVVPQRGKAVVFCNILANGLPDPRTVHGGEAPNREIKYVGYLSVHKAATVQYSLYSRNVDS